MTADDDIPSMEAILARLAAEDAEEIEKATASGVAPTLSDPDESSADPTPATHCISANVASATMETVEEWSGEAQPNVPTSLPAAESLNATGPDKSTPFGAETEKYAQLVVRTMVGNVLDDISVDGSWTVGCVLRRLTQTAPLSLWTEYRLALGAEALRPEMRLVEYMSGCVELTAAVVNSLAGDYEARVSTSRTCTLSLHVDRTAMCENIRHIDDIAFCALIRGRWEEVSETSARVRIVQDVHLTLRHLIEFKITTDRDLLCTRVDVYCDETGEPVGDPNVMFASEGTIFRRKVFSTDAAIEQEPAALPESPTHAPPAWTWGCSYVTGPIPGNKLLTTDLPTAGNSRPASSTHSAGSALHTPTVAPTGLRGKGIPPRVRSARAHSDVGLGKHVCT